VTGVTSIERIRLDLETNAGTLDRWGGGGVIAKFSIFKCFHVNVLEIKGNSATQNFSSWGLHLAKLRLTFAVRLNGLELATLFKIR
jgi:hypothetical protein